MAKTYVYLIGGSLDSLDLDDRKQIVKMGLNLEGYCDLGWAEGYAIYGTLPKLKKFVEDYIGVEIVDDYLFEEDVFEDMADDGDWKDINFQSWELLNTFKKSFGESKKSVGKSLKESISDDDIIFKVATTMKEVSNLRLDKEFDYMFDKKTLCDMIWYICDELNADYKFHLYPKYDHGTQIRVDFIRDSVNVGWMAFDVMIKDTYPLTVEIENMLEK